MKTSTKIIIAIGLLAAGVAVAVKVRNASPVILTPEQRFAQAALNPATTVGAEIKRFMNVNGIAYTPENIQPFIDWHLDPANRGQSLFDNYVG